MKPWDTLCMVMRIVVLLSVVGSVGCSAAATPAPTPAPRETSKPTLTSQPARATATTTPVAYAIVALKAPGFASIPAEMVAPKPSVVPYKTDPAAAANADVVARFSPAQVKALQEQGFVVTPWSRSQIYTIYTQAKSGGTPVFVTTDALLHTYHVLYDYTLRQVEDSHLMGDLKTLMTAMVSASEAQLKAAGAAKPVQEAATRNLAFFAVAARLLDSEAKVPESVRALVDKELALIQEHAGLADSPIFGYKEDYSQYVPRGHYTRTEAFGRYFRAMMWLGRIMFRLRPGAAPAALAEGRLETRQALLIVAALQNTPVGTENAVAVWERIYAPTVFFVGQTDDLNVYDYNEALRNSFGERLTLAELGDDARVDAFIAAASMLRPPKIVSSFVTDIEKPEEVTKGFRFMGQRFVPDSYIFQQLVYDKVKLYQGQGKPFTLEMTQAGAIRAFPRGLDVAAVLGSERAVAILRAEGDTDYQGYAEQSAKLRQQFASLPAGQWTENLYWNWLHTLRAILAPKGEGYPAFMRSPAWADKCLNTFLGSWTELRHDTLLYAKQSMTVGLTAARPVEVKLTGYVEPEVEVWNRLLTLVRQTRAGLKERKLLSDEFDQRLGLMDDLVAQLRDISVAELAGQPLNDKQAALVETIGRQLEDITTLSEKTKDQIASQTDERIAIVADVHTDVNTSQALEEGVGDALPMYVVYPLGGGQTAIGVGAVFSHYEFKQPMSQRLTDEAWQKLTPKPPLAPWAKALIPE